MRYAPGVSPGAAFASLQRDFGDTVLQQLPAQDVINLQSVDGLPTLLAALVVLLGAMTLGNTLVTSVRRHRRDLAILKTVGFVRRQVAAVVVWQATSFALLALLVGLPLGIAGGRWAWELVAVRHGVRRPGSRAVASRRVDRSRDASRRERCVRYSGLERGPREAGGGDAERVAAPDCKASTDAP